MLHLITTVKRQVSSQYDSVIIILIVIVCCLTMCSCTTSRITNHASRIAIDTIYLSNTQYDSIYIFKDRLTDRSKDTVYLRDVSVEYRYKLLRDTIRVIQRDSIPYEVTVIETKELTRPLTWFDHLTRTIFWILATYLFFKFLKFLFKLKFMNNS